MQKSALAVGFVVVVLPIGCGTSSSSPGGSAPAPASTAFDPGPVPVGYVRYEVPVVPAIPPGADVMYCQWVAPPSDHAQNVLEVRGMQGPAGHHAVLYANSEVENVGTTRECADQDMVTVTFLGAVGGEGNAGPAAKLPDGVVFQMPPNQGIMANTHYINTSDKPVDGHTVLDVKYADPDPNLTVAGSFALNYLGIQIPPGPNYSVDVECKVDQKFSLVMFTNHMHRFGTQAFTEVIHPDNTTAMISKDDTWTGEEAFNPPYVHFTKDAPFVLNPGDTLHERCTWKNDTANTIAFPTEMCVGAAYSLEGGPQYICNATPI